MTIRISPSTGLEYDARTCALLARLGGDVTEQDLADLAVACADRAGLSIDVQIALTEALNARQPRPVRLRLVTDADAYFAAFDAVDRIKADLVLYEQYHPGAAAAIREWAARRNRAVVQRAVDGWSGVLTVSTGVPGTSGMRSIEVYLR